MNELGLSLSNAVDRLSKASFSDDGALHNVIKDVESALRESDMSVELVSKLIKDVKGALYAASSGGGTAVNRARVVERAVVEGLTRMLDPGTLPYKPRKRQPNVFLFVGLQGAGKTTTVMKFAHYYAVRKWKVAMVCADTFRAGAFDQLKQNATRVRVPFYGSATETDPAVIAREGVDTFKAEGYEIIIVDTSGRHKQAAGLWDEMRFINAAVRPDETVFVMDGSIGQAAQTQAQAFKDTVDVGSVIITKLDGHAKGGGALSAVAATNAPIVFIGTGEGFEDLKPFDASRFIGKLLGKGDMGGLMADFKERGLLQAQDALLAKVKAAGGKFTLRDALEQLKAIAGDSGTGVGNMIDMLPRNISANFRAKNQQKPAGAEGQRVKMWTCLSDSMTNAELDGEVDLSASRYQRILRGSGCPPGELENFLNTRTQMGSMIAGLNSNEMLMNEDVMARELKRNPEMVRQQLLKSFDARTIESLGGIDALIEFMKDPNFDPTKIAAAEKKKKGGKGAVKK